MSLLVGQNQLYDRRNSETPKEHAEELAKAKQKIKKLAVAGIQFYSEKKQSFMHQKQHAWMIMFAFIAPTLNNLINTINI